MPLCPQRRSSSTPGCSGAARGLVPVVVSGADPQLASWLRQVARSAGLGQRTPNEPSLNFSERSTSWTLVGRCWASIWSRVWFVKGYHHHHHHQKQIPAKLNSRRHAFSTLNPQQTTNRLRRADYRSQTAPTGWPRSWTGPARAVLGMRLFRAQTGSLTKAPGRCGLGALRRSPASR